MTCSRAGGLVPAWLRGCWGFVASVSALWCQVARVKQGRYLLRFGGSYSCLECPPPCCARALLPSCSLPRPSDPCPHSGMHGHVCLDTWASSSCLSLIQFTLHPLGFSMRVPHGPQQMRSPAGQVLGLLCWVQGVQVISDPWPALLVQLALGCAVPSLWAQL